MLLETSLACPAGAAAVRRAASAVLADGLRTGDLLPSGSGGLPIGCRAMGDAVLARLDRP
jgi:hypothetical protein